MSLKVFDITGGEIMTLEESYLNPGTYQRTFNGEALPSGVYFVRLQAGGVF